jgi:hypothetical protein
MSNKDIPFTFGIITDACDESFNRICEIEKSICNLNIPEYEIILVGQENRIKQIPNIDNFKFLKIINFNEGIKKGWITAKKNLITKHAKYENIVYSHDYIVYDNDWYKGWLTYGDNFKIGMNRILDYEGNRYRDWSIFPDSHTENALKYAKDDGELREWLLPYEETDLNRFQYISGAYWVGKKQVMQEIPLDEGLTWGYGEDVIWSHAVRTKYKFSMNTHSTVHVLKRRTGSFSLMKDETILKMKEYIKIIDSGGNV